MTISLHDICFFNCTVEHGGTPAISPCTGYCWLGARAPSLVLSVKGAPSSSARCLFSSLALLRIPDEDDTPPFSSAAAEVREPGVSKKRTLPRNSAHRDCVPHSKYATGVAHHAWAWCLWRLPLSEPLSPLGRRMFRRLRKDDGYAVFSLPHPHVRAAPVNAASENHFFIVEGGICVRKNRFRSQMPCASARRFPWGKLAGSRKRAKGGRY